MRCGTSSSAKLNTPWIGARLFGLHDHRAVEILSTTASGLECAPHNWGNVLDLALHFHVELALPNAYWFEMPFPAEYTDRSYFKYKFRSDSDGYVPAPTEPGLGYPIDRDALDKVTKRVLR